MEVHHHSHHPKKWKEYITEFLMLFLAVSLGFFAENLREQQIEKHRDNYNFLKRSIIPLRDSLYSIKSMKDDNVFSSE